MDAWQTILLAIGGNTVLFAVLGFLAKSLLEKLIIRDTKLYESELKASTDAAVERLRNELMLSVESYKVKLKKSEFLFEREYQAELDFSNIARLIIRQPNKPGMTWENAMDEVIYQYERTEKFLDDFLKKCGPLITGEERELIESAKLIALDGRLSDKNTTDQERYQTADSLCKKISDIESRLINRIREQTSL